MKANKFHIPVKHLAFLLLWWKLMTHMFICQVQKGELTYFAGSFCYIKQCALQIELQSSEKIVCGRDYNFRFSCVNCSIEKHWIPACSPFLMVSGEILMHCYIKRLISACMWLLERCMKEGSTYSWKYHRYICTSCPLSVKHWSCPCLRWIFWPGEIFSTALCFWG